MKPHAPYGHIFTRDTAVAAIALALFALSYSSIVAFVKKRLKTAKYANIPTRKGGVRKVTKRSHTYNDKLISNLKVSGFV